MTQSVLGIVGGSGFYDLPGFEKPEWKTVKSPWGEPSDQILHAEVEGLPVREPEDISRARQALDGWAYLAASWAPWEAWPSPRDGSPRTQVAILRRSDSPIAPDRSSFSLRLRKARLPGLSCPAVTTLSRSWRPPG